jgi:hypothetical protein
MAIGGFIFFRLTAKVIRGVIFHCGTLVVGIIVFRRATPLQQYAALSSAAPPQ